MKTIHLGATLKALTKINDEIRYQTCFEEKTFSAGLIAFSPRKKRDSKQIHHADKDVVCHVLKGNGRLRVNGRRIPLRPGTICHIPKGTPHDFAAAERSRLVLFYSLIHTG
ncbi:MAG TPA: AraC family ligand binding domain-containing protein [Candidatus Binatia bacterium]|jgi:quercetin dioxygenase-like cupin family protein